jgi:hypothetical protein
MCVRLPPPPPARERRIRPLLLQAGYVIEPAGTRLGTLQLTEPAPGAIPESPVLAIGGPPDEFARRVQAR